MEVDGTYGGVGHHRGPGLRPGLPVGQNVTFLILISLRQGSREKSFTQCMSLDASCLTVPLQTSLTVAKSDNTTSASGYVALKREGSCSVVVMAHVAAKRRLLIKLRTRSIG
jgi:hypothetical protein